MAFPRRSFLQLAAGALVLPAVTRVAGAQTYPARPVHVIIGLPAGNSGDIVARLMGQWLSDRFGQTFVIENRPGAGTGLATEAVVRAPPDGYTLLMPVSTSAVNATLYADLSFNFVRDIAPIALVGRSPFVMVVEPSFPAKTLPEFIGYAKANPKKVNMASAGNGSTPHVFGELFKMMTGIDLVHVPYRSSYMPDLLGGQVQVAFTTIPVSIEYIRTGRLRALAVTTTRRSDALADIPAISEFVPGYEASGWYGVGAPKDTSAEIVATLNKAINAFVADPTTTARFSDLGVEPMTTTPAEFATFIADEVTKWSQVIRFAGIKPN